MKIKHFFLFAVLVLLTFTSFSISDAGWEFLGKREVNFNLDKDEIPVTIKDGIFSKIKLEVKRAPVEFKKVVVHYRNDETESLDIRDVIPAGGQTRAIDLKGNKRIITKVVFFYETKPNLRARAVVRLYGMK